MNKAYNLNQLTNSTMDEQWEDLQPKYDNRKSFYGKAETTVLKSGLRVLKSYSTIVAFILPNGKLLLNGLYSMTTERHIHDFALQFSKDYKGGSLDDYVLGKAVNLYI